MSPLPFLVKPVEGALSFSHADSAVPIGRRLRASVSSGCRSRAIDIQSDAAGCRKPAVSIDDCMIVSFASFLVWFALLRRYLASQLGIVIGGLAAE